MVEMVNIYKNGKSRQKWSKWFKMFQNDPKWSKMVNNEKKWSKLVKIVKNRQFF